MVFEVSLHGRRTLHLRLRDPFDLSEKVVDEPQRPGDVYLGNPVAYEHGLQYDAATWDRCEFVYSFFSSGV